MSGATKRDETKLGIQEYNNGKKIARCSHLNDERYCFWCPVEKKEREG